LSYSFERVTIASATSPGASASSISTFSTPERMRCAAPRIASPSSRLSALGSRVLAEEVDDVDVCVGGEPGVWPAAGRQQYPLDRRLLAYISLLAPLLGEDVTLRPGENFLDGVTAEQASTLAVFGLGR
jgi:hypothetical protein